MYAIRIYIWLKCMVHVDKIFLYMEHLGIAILHFGYHHQPFLKWRYCFFV